MTDTDKVSIIGKMASDVMEFTDYDKGALDALVTCILTVTDYKTEQNEQL